MNRKQLLALPAERRPDHLYVLEKVKRGLQRAETEGAVSHEDAKARLGKWLAA